MNINSASASTFVAPTRTPVVEPAARKPWWSFFAAKRFLFISILLHLILAGGATVWIVQVTRLGHKRSFVAAEPATRATKHPLEHQVQMAKKQVSAPPAVKRITTLSAMKIALPPLPALPMQLTPHPISPTTLSGAGMAAGAGFGLGTGSMGGGGGGNGGGITSFIGGLRVTAQKLGVALDVSGSVRDYQAEMHAFVGKAFKGSEISEFSTAGFITRRSKRGSMGMSVLEFLNSPEHFDAIYIFSDFGETRDGLTTRDGVEEKQDLWEEVKRLVREKKVKLYLHVLREPGKEDRISPILNDVIMFAKSTGGGVKIGPMTHLSDDKTDTTAHDGASRL